MSVDPDGPRDILSEQDDKKAEERYWRRTRCNRRCGQPVAMVDPGGPRDILGEQADKEAEERDWRWAHCNERCGRPVAMVDPGGPMDILGEHAARDEEERNWRRTRCNCMTRRQPQTPRDNAFLKPDQIPRQLPGVVSQQAEADDTCCCCCCCCDDCKKSDDERQLPTAAPVPTQVSCFVRGTRIRTSTGYRPIENLVPGDRLPSMFGGEQPIRRIRRTVFERAAGARPWPEHAQPIRIAPSTLADNVPVAELVLSAAHAVLLDGWLISIDNLVNGTTIALQPVAGDVLELFHVVLEQHDVIDAEGTPCESLLLPPQ